MSGILQKLKRKSLFEQLQQRFPIDLVQPYGKVMIIPSKAFKTEWSLRLKDEGFESFSSSYGVQSCFFVRKKKKPSIQEPERDSKPVKEKKPLTPEEREMLIRLHQNGSTAKQIAEKLGCKIQVIGGVIRHLKKSKEKHEETKSNSNDPEIIRDLLASLTILYPEHAKACIVLLDEIRARMAVGLHE